VSLSLGWGDAVFFFLFLFGFGNAWQHRLQPELVEINENPLPSVWVSAGNSSRSRSLALNDFLFQIKSGTVFFKARGNEWKPVVGKMVTNITFQFISAGLLPYSINLFGVDFKRCHLGFHFRKNDFGIRYMALSWW